MAKKVTKSSTVRPVGGASFVERDGKFYVRFRDADGVRRMRFAGTTMKEAVVTAKIELGDVDRDREAKAAGKIVGAEPLRFEKFCEEYLPVLRASMRDRTMASIATQVVAFDAFLKKRGDKTVDKVTKKDADEFLAGEKARGCKDSYLSRIAWILGLLWRAAIERGLATHDPFKGRRFRRESDVEVPYLTPAQLDGVLALVDARHRDLVTVVASTGLRAEEAIGLIWNDLEPSAGGTTIMLTRQTVKRRPLKTKACKRVVHLQTRARQILARRKADAAAGEAFVFAGQKREHVLRSLHDACDAAELPRLRLHDLRHLFCSHLVQAGVPTSTVARMVGHADGGALVAKLYGRWIPQDAEARAMAALEAFRAAAS